MGNLGFVFKFSGFFFFFQLKCVNQKKTSGNQIRGVGVGMQYKRPKLSSLNYS